MLEGRGTNDIKSELKTKFWPTYKVKYCVYYAFITHLPFLHRLTGNYGQQLR